MAGHSLTQRNYIREGENQDRLLRSHVQEMLGLKKNKVQAKRHTIISGPPGIGKSYTTMQAIKASKINYLQFGAGTTQAALALQLAYAVSKLGPEDDLVVLLDDADDVVFKDYETINRFKFAMAKDDPVYSHNVNLTNQRARYEKAGRSDLVDAIDSFTIPGSTGIVIPTDQVRFVVICNANLEDRKQFSRKLWTSVDAIVDRVKYRRLTFDWQVSWGWLAYVLKTTQPFTEHPLSSSQKNKLTDWMWVRWDQVRNPSYRTIEEMAEYMINDPKNYEDQWETLLRGK